MGCSVVGLILVGWPGQGGVGSMEPPDPQGKDSMEPGWVVPPSPAGEMIPLDTGSFDTGSFDTGSFDTGSFDTGSFDTGSFDTGSFDTGDRPPIPEPNAADPWTEPDPTSEVIPDPSSAPAPWVDPELGILRLQEQEPASQPRPAPAQTYPRFTFALQGQVNYVYSSNILASPDPLGEDLVQEGISFSIVPQLSPRTAIIAQVGGSWTQYSDLYALDYRQFHSQIRVRHQLSSQAYGELAWKHQEFFEADGGDRLLGTNAFQASLVHQKDLSDRLALTNVYQSRWSLANPQSRNQVVQQLGSSLNYQVHPNVDLGVSYNLEVAAFTQVDRLDFYNQAIAHLAWEFAPRQRLRIFSGYAFGDSSLESIRFNGFLVGVGLEAGLRF